jgi:hypothetical protein
VEILLTGLPIVSKPEKNDKVAVESERASNYFECIYALFSL